MRRQTQQQPNRWPAVLAAVILTPVLQAQVSFRELEALPGVPAEPNNKALAVSSDGARVLGWSRTDQSAAGRMAVVWGSTAFPVGLGGLTTRNQWGQVRAASADGATLVGSTSERNGLRAFTWNGAGGLNALPELQGGNGAEALGVSADGAVVAGYTSFRDVVTATSPILVDQATRWVNGQPEALGFLPGGYTSRALDVSADGLVVVGRSDTAANDGDHEAFLWTAAGGMVSLGGIPGGITRSAAVAVSSDGQVVTGWGVKKSNPFETRLWRWTAGGGLVGLGTLPGHLLAKAADIDGDGDVIVGWSAQTPGLDRVPLIWDPVNGKRDLTVVLTAAGIDLSGWLDASGNYWMEATGVSADGKTVVGFGRKGNFYRGWVATL